MYIYIIFIIFFIFIYIHLLFYICLYLFIFIYLHCFHPILYLFTSTTAALLPFTFFYIALRTVFFSITTCLLIYYLCIRLGRPKFTMFILDCCALILHCTYALLTRPRGPSCLLHLCCLCTDFGAAPYALFHPPSRPRLYCVLHCRPSAPLVLFAHAWPFCFHYCVEACLHRFRLALMSCGPFVSTCSAFDLF